MNFFSNKKREKIVEDSSFQKDLETEIIVHNMPSQQKIEGDIINPDSAGAVSFASDKKKETKDFKIVGFLIIFFGLIFISLIIFLTYKFVISPTAKPLDNSSKSRDLKNTEKNEVLEEKEDKKNSPEEEISDSGVDIIKREDEDEGAVSDDDFLNNEEQMQEEFSGIKASELPPLIDSDGDGLYDEEEIILQTSIFLKDTDGDGYEDLFEIKNGYNPIGSGLLEDAESISVYKNIKNRFSFLYPTAWDLQELSDNLIAFEINDSSFIQLSIIENHDKLGILNWYQENFPEESIDYQSVISKPGYEGVVSKNKLNVYFTDEKRSSIFIFSYMPISTERLSLINIFSLIYSSFKIE